MRIICINCVKLLTTGYWLQTCTFLEKPKLKLTFHFMRILCMIDTKWYIVLITTLIKIIFNNFNENPCFFLSKIRYRQIIYKNYLDFISNGNTSTTDWALQPRPPSSQFTAPAVTSPEDQDLQLRIPSSWFTAPAVTSPEDQALSPRPPSSRITASAVPPRHQGPTTYIVPTPG